MFEVFGQMTWRLEVVDVDVAVWWGGASVVLGPCSHHYGYYVIAAAEGRIKEIIRYVVLVFFKHYSEFQYDD